MTRAPLYPGKEETQQQQQLTRLKDGEGAPGLGQPRPGAEAAHAGPHHDHVVPLPDLLGHGDLVPGALEVEAEQGEAGQQEAAQGEAEPQVQQVEEERRRQPRHQQVGGRRVAGQRPVPPSLGSYRQQQQSEQTRKHSIL